MADTDQPSDPATPPPEERRRRERFGAGRIMALVNRAAVRIVDVSLTGLGFESEKALDPGGLHRIELFTPLGDLKLIGRITWCHVQEQDDNSQPDAGPRYRIGIRFSPLPAAEARTLARLLALLAERHADGQPTAQEETTSEFVPEDVSEVVRTRRRTDPAE